MSILFGLLACAEISNAQKNTLKNVTGIWVSDSTSVKLNFVYYKANKLHLTVRDTITGEKMKIRKLKIIGDTVKTTEKFRSMRWKTRNEYYLIAPDTLKNIITGDAHTTIYFRRE